jgi:precorrin-3B synthase
VTTAERKHINRRGNCPALSSPMQTGDGLLVRLNPISQALSPEQLIALCESADRNGNGIVEVTARGSLQIRGLSAISASSLSEDVNLMGIEVRKGVPVETGPLAGLDPEEIADPLPLANKIRMLAKSAGLAARLGPKVSVLVDGGGQWTLDAIAADVRCLAMRSEAGGCVWQLSIGGNANDARCIGVFETPEAATVVLSVLDAIAALGPAARASDLPSPGGCFGGLLHGRSAKMQHLGAIQLKNGSSALSVALPFGSMQAEGLIAFARASQGLGAQDIRPAPPRSLIVTGVDRQACAKLQKLAAELGFIVARDDPRTHIAACPGSPACASGRFATRAVAHEIAVTASSLFDGSVSLHVSGCAKGCAHPAPSTLTLVGDEKGVGFVAGGTARSLPLAYSQPKALAASLARMAALVGRERRQGETAAACLSRLGGKRLAAAFRQEKA